CASQYLCCLFVSWERCSYPPRRKQKCRGTVPSRNQSPRRVHALLLGGRWIARYSYIDYCSRRNSLCVPHFQHAWSTPSRNGTLIRLSDIRITTRSPITSPRR